MGNANALSQLPLPEHPKVSDIPPPGDIKMLFLHFSDTIITASHTRKWTEKDPTLSGNSPLPPSWLAKNNF